MDIANMKTKDVIAFTELIAEVARVYRLNASLSLIEALRAKAREYDDFLNVVDNPAIARELESHRAFLSSLSARLDK